MLLYGEEMKIFVVPYAVACAFLFRFMAWPLIVLVLSAIRNSRKKKQ